MKSSPLALALALGLGAFGIVMLGAGPAALAAPAKPAALRAPLLDYRLRVLPNGLKVYSLVDHTTTNVAVQVWYGVGAKNDPPGRSGMAHLCEHLMFRGSRDMPAEFIDRLTDDVGGENDASTDDDDTEYDEVIPAGYLERLLWAEAERMASLDVGPADFVAERKVVEQELRQEDLADPYRALVEIEAPRASFTRAVYRQSVIGSIADLEAATPAEVRAFHSRYYRPDNASLVVVGDFDPSRLDAWADEYFGAIARPGAAMVVAKTAEPPRTVHRVVDSYASDAPSPALLLTYAGPPADSGDASALKVLDAILTLGRTSRLNTDLVARHDLAGEVFSEVDLWQHAGLIQIGLTLEGGVSMARGETALRAALARVTGGAIAESEVRAAKNCLLASLLHDRESIEGEARAIGEAAVLDSDASHANSDVQALESVTLGDVRRVAASYLVDARRLTIRYHAVASRAQRRLSGSFARAAASQTSDAVAVVDDRPSPAIPRSPPPAAEVRPPVAPTIFDRTLPNGLRVIVGRTGGQPIATVVLSFGGGSAFDPSDEAGLADMTVALAARGASDAAAGERARRIAELGDTLATQSDYDSVGFRLTGLAASLPAGLEALAAIARHPHLDQVPVSALRGALLDAAQGSDVDQDAISHAAVNHLVFGNGPYGHLAEDAPQRLSRISSRDVARKATALFRPNNAVLVVTGGVDPEWVFALAEQAFGDWPSRGGTPPAAREAGPPSPPPGRVVAINSPGAEEAKVTIAARTIRRSAPSYYATELANALLGGGESARLSTEIRVRRGLTYDASSQLDEYRDIGLFTASAQTENAAAPEVAVLALAQLKGLAELPPPPGELAARKAELIGEFYREAATGDGLADLLTEDALDGIDLADVARYADRINAVSGAEAQSAAMRLADPAGLSVVIVGDVKQFTPALQARFPSARVIHPVSLASLASALD